MNKSKARTSWEESSKWYDKLVGDEGHYYHQKIILPNTLKLLNLKSGDRLLDIGCGQGILARHIPIGMHYTGIDASSSLINSAKKSAKDKKHEFILHDATLAEKLSAKEFTHATAILSLQNMSDHRAVIQLASLNLVNSGILILVINHPSFRIPRQSGWETFASNKLQYRWITKYMSAMEIPMQTHIPGGKTVKSVSFHQPLSEYFSAFRDNGFLTEDLQEWVSDKESSGRHAGKENRARAEIPLFMAIKLRKAA